MSDIFEELVNDYLSGMTPRDRLRTIDNQGEIDRLGDEAFVRLALVEAVKRAAAPAAVKARLAAREVTLSPLAFFNSIGAPGRAVVPPESDPKVTAHVDLLTTKAAVLQAEDELRKARVDGAPRKTISALAAKVEQVTKAHADVMTPAETPTSAGEEILEKFRAASQATDAAHAEWRRAGYPTAGEVYDAHKAAMAAKREAAAELKKI